MPAHDTPVDDRPLKPALWSGWRGRCPNCKAGALFQSYLKVNHSCAHCGQELHHQRADDGPAYITILIVGHIVAPLILWVFMAWRPEPLTLIAVFSAMTVILSLLLLPRIKGAFIALQWSRRMHGFDENRLSA